MNIYTLQTLQAALAARMPINRDFLHKYAKNPQAQQAAREQER
jgi:hypothetical protein